MYTPDSWVLLHIKGNDPHYRVLGGWSGGYTTGDSWRMNSGVTKVEDLGTHYLFHGCSGSVYKCHKDSYRISLAILPVIQYYDKNYKDGVEVVSEDVIITDIDWGLQDG